MNTSYPSSNTPLIIFKRNWLLAICVFVPVFLAVLALGSLQKPTYTAESSLRLVKRNSTAQLTGVGSEFDTVEPLVQSNSPLSTEVEVLRSLPVIERTIDHLDLKTDQGELMNSQQFLDNLLIKPVSEADVLRIRYKDRDLARAKRVINTLMDVYLETSINSRNRDAIAAELFIETQIPEAKSTVDQLEKTLRQFRESSRIVDLPEEQRVAIADISDLGRQIVAAESQFADTNGQLITLQKQLDLPIDQAIPLTILSQSEGVQSVLQEIWSTEAQLTTELNRFTESAPSVQRLRSKIQLLNAELQNRITRIPGKPITVGTDNPQVSQLQQQLTTDIVRLAGTQQGLRQQLDVLRSRRQDYYQRITQLPRLDQTQRELLRKLEAAQSRYLTLLQKSEEVRIAASLRTGNAEILSPATEVGSKTTSQIANYLSATLLGGLAATALVYLRERQNRSLKSSNQAQEILGLPVLSEIPIASTGNWLPFEGFAPSLPRLVMRESPYSPASEAYRILQTRLSSIPDPCRTIALTSAVMGEGKSTVVANLALTFAQAGKRVLLIDSDFRHPIQDKIWGLSNEVGLSNVLSDQVSAEMATWKITPELDVLPTGAAPAHILTLLPRFHTLLQQLKAYDYILIDTPALTLTADAQALCQLVDGVLFLVRLNWRAMDIQAAEMVNQIFKQSSYRVLGQVINGGIPLSVYPLNNTVLLNSNGDLSKITPSSRINLQTQATIPKKLQ